VFLKLNNFPHILDVQIFHYIDKRRLGEIFGPLADPEGIHGAILKPNELILQNYIWDTVYTLTFRSVGWNVKEDRSWHSD
jgi:hypothetical protein